RRAASGPASHRARAGGEDRRQEPARGPPGEGIAERHRAARREEELSLRAGVHARALYLARLAGGAQRLRREARRQVHRRGQEEVAMDLTFTPKQEAFRREAREWLAAHVPATRLASMDTAAGFEQHRVWERTLNAGRWAMVPWPVEYGGR